MPVIETTEALIVNVVYTKITLIINICTQWLNLAIHDYRKTNYGI